MSDIPWGNYPGTILYTVDKFGMASLWYGPAYMHGTSGRFIPVTAPGTEAKEPILLGLTNQTPQEGLKVVCPAMPIEEQAVFLSKCIAPAAGQRNSASPQMGEAQALFEFGKRLDGEQVGFTPLSR